VFPLWGEPTGRLAREMIAGGLEARVCAAAESRLRGMAFDEAFLGGLAPGIDPCGENGEFHTYVHGLPGFSRAVAEWHASSH
jgi:diphthamide synthase (EF-2-diphthine--ammonia ligase)